MHEMGPADAVVYARTLFSIENAIMTSMRKKACYSRNFEYI
jgi:hypothetical protein